ncbi:hypothetical protein ANO11243_003390 [Dothideomycetidae sp. 11243]|nr:hypothetical protein ANO11243_003390 [fungal sp. No.11243]
MKPSLRIWQSPSRQTCLRHASIQSRHQSSSSSAAPSPKWLSELPARIGKCLTFGTTEAQTRDATEVLRAVASDWRELMAGSEGFLTGSDRRGLYRQSVVWGDMDSMAIFESLISDFSSTTGHVNNVVYNKWAESGRALWARRYATHLDRPNATAWKDVFTPRGQGLILRSIHTDFKFVRFPRNFSLKQYLTFNQPMTFPDRVTVYHKLGTQPTTETDSFKLDVLILSERQRRPAARCVEDIVMYDYRRGAKATLPPYMLDAFRETWRLQEEARQVNGDRIRDLLDKVRRLEQQTWDRPDAVES